MLIGNFLAIPSYFKIEILAIQDEFDLSRRKGLTTALLVDFCCWQLLPQKMIGTTSTNLI